MQELVRHDVKLSPAFRLGGWLRGVEPHVQKKEPHLLAPFVARNGASLVLLKRWSTLGFLWVQ